MGKKQTCPAVKMKARKAKILAANLYCNIPKPAPPAKVLEADKPYQELRDARKKELHRHSRTPTGHIRLKTPWYMLTRGKIYKFDDTAWLKVESESTRLHNKTIKKKFTHEQLIVGMVQNKVKDWEKTNPEPLKEINGTKNAFYETEHREWINERCKIWNKSLSGIKNRPEKLMTKYLQQTNPELMAAA